VLKEKSAATFVLFILWENRRIVITAVQRETHLIIAFICTIICIFIQFEQFIQT